MDEITNARKIWPSELPCKKCGVIMERRGHHSRGNLRRAMVCPACGAECIAHPIAYERVVDGRPMLIGYSHGSLPAPEIIVYR